MSYCEAGFPMGCATSSGGRGLVGGHAYSVLDVRQLHGVAVGRQTKLDGFVEREVEIVDPAPALVSASASKYASSAAAADASSPPPLRLVRVRNPWGRKEWNGDWGAKSETWTSRLGAELGNTRADDGTFWMSWHDFLTAFSVVDVCKAHRGWHALSLPGAAHRAEGDGPPGTTRAAVDFGMISSEDGDAFEIEVAGDGGGGGGGGSWAYVMALQHTKRGRGGDAFWYADVGIAVYEKNARANAAADDDAWTPLGAVLGAKERVAQAELMLERGKRYLARLFSVGGGAAGPPTAPVTLRVYRRVLSVHWSPCDRVGAVNADP